MLPFAEIVFVSTLSAQQVAARLTDLVEQEKNLWKRLNSPIEKPYRGRLFQNRFVIRRVVYYRNSFRPEISGVITATDEGSMIYTQMRLIPLTLVFLIIWCGFIFAVLFLFLITPFRSFTHIPLILLGFAYVLTIVSFNLEMKRSVNDMTTVFRARLIKQDNLNDSIH